MPNTKLGRHEWLKHALAARGFRQSDVAKEWDVDDAVVSRFIKSGEPELTWDRAQSLAKMLEMTLDEMRLRLQEGMPPRAAAARAEAAPASNGAPPAVHLDSAMAMKDLHSAVNRALGTLGITGVRVVLEFNGKGEPA